MQPLLAHRAPDLHAPRYRRQASGTLNQATYAELRQLVPAIAGLSDARLKALLLDITRALWGALVQQPDGVELPALTGHLLLAACPPRRQDSIDYKASALAGVRVRQLNHATDGYLAKIVYSNAAPRYHFKHHELWSFRACKKLRQVVSQQFPRQWQLYHRLNPDRQAKSLFFHQHRMLDQRAQDATTLLSYDELAF